MLEVNIWRHAYGPKEGTFMGPILSALVSRPIGHADLKLTVVPKAKLRSKIEKAFADLPHEKTKIYLPKASRTNKVIPEVLDAHQNNLPSNLSHEELLQSYENYLIKYVSNEYKTKRKLALVYSHSFWPQEQLSSRHFLTHLLGKSVMPAFSTLEADMIGESEFTFEKDDDGNVCPVYPKIKHPHLMTDNKEIEKKLLEKIEKINNRIKRYKHLKTKISNKLLLLDKENRELQKEKTNLLQKNKILKNTITALLNSEIDLESNSPDAMDKLVAILEESIKALNQRIKEIDLKLSENQEIKLSNNQDLISVQKIVNKFVNRRENIHQKISVIQSERRKCGVTKGKSPDFTILLPTRESGQPYYLNKYAILRKMQDHHKTNYNIFKNNCSSIVKDALVAGIPDKLKERMENDLGVSEKFFQVNNGETPLTLLEWVLKLEECMSELNKTHSVTPTKFFAYT